MVKNIFSSFTKDLGLKETPYFQVLLIMTYVLLIILLIPIAAQFLKLLIIFIFFILYFIPYLITNSKNRKDRKMFLLNLLLGWTLVGWIILLVIALNQKEIKNKKRK
jgi:4-hydroxybenzoate polyprenyltransferase